MFVPATKKKSTLFSLVACAAAVGLVGCGLSPHENNSIETISITPESTGRMAIAALSEQDSLTGTLSSAGSGLEALSLENKFSISTAASLGKQGLGKISSGAASPISVDLADTASGKARLIFAVQTALVSSFDTVTIKWDDIARDPLKIDKNIVSVAGEKTSIGGKTERYAVSDLDNDGVVAGEGQYNGKARFAYQSIQGAVTENLLMEVSAGPDKNFSADADNKINSLSWEKSRSGAAAGRATFTDADGDGVLIDRAAAQNIIDVTLFEKNPPFKPFVDSVSLTMRVTIGGADGSGKIIRLSGKEYRVSGRVVTLSLTDIHGNADVMPFDTAVATFAMIPVLQNGWKDSVRLVFDVQSGLQNSSDNLLLELHMSKEHTSGIVKTRTFDFVTTNPVHDGRKPVSGHVEGTVTYGNGKTASISADFSATGFSGTWTGPNGNTLTVKWDKNGNVISQN
jgi:hypothetical protein